MIGEKVFISSTSFDLKDLRAELARALEEWGYLSLWNESPDFPKKSGLHSHDMCLDTVEESDIYLLIIDRRYGGTYAGKKYPREDISITWYETKIAFQKKKEIYSFIRDEVWNERPTYKKNLKKGVQIKPYHVDNPRVFDFIDFVVHLPRDNWIYTFKNSVELKEKLKIILKVSQERKVFPPTYLNNITNPEPNFVGRTERLKTITEWYKNSDVHIGALIGWGGEGKSAIVRKWYDTLEENNINPCGIFWWGFYRNAYLDPFLDSLFNYLSQGKFSIDDYKTSWLKIDKIKELLIEGEYLIILDGLEELQKDKESGEMFGCMRHREFSEILKFLSDAKVKGLCLITSRYPLIDIKKWEDSSYKKIEVERLSIEEGRALFEKVGIKGNREEIDAVIDDYKGHALSLTLLITYLVEDHKGDVKKAKDIPPFYSDKEAGGKAHRMLLWYEKQLTQAQITFMKIFSLFRKSVRVDDFEGIFRSEMRTSINQVIRYMSYFSFIRMKDNLCDRRLISMGQDDTYTTHPLIKGYFESIMSEDDRKACHERIYEHIGTYAPEKPETLEEMQPLFEQIYHGCVAGLYDEAWQIYWECISQGENYVSLYKFCTYETDLALMREFFPIRDISQEPLVVNPVDKREILAIVGYCIMNLGRLTEAVPIFERKNAIALKSKDWHNASNGYGNLAILYARLGLLVDSVNAASKALSLADSVDNERDTQRDKSFSLAALGWAAHLQGKQDEAGKAFQQAEEFQRQLESTVRYLIRLGGVQHADYLRRVTNVDYARQVAEANLKICEHKQWRGDLSRVHRVMGDLNADAEQHDDARKHYDKALEIARSTSFRPVLIEALLAHGRWAARRRDVKAAYNDLKEALTYATEEGFRIYEVDIHVGLAWAYLVSGNTSEVQVEARIAKQMSAEMGYHLGQVDAEEVLAELKKVRCA